MATALLYPYCHEDDYLTVKGNVKTILQGCESVMVKKSLFTSVLAEKSLSYLWSISERIAFRLHFSLTNSVYFRKLKAARLTGTVNIYSARKAAVKFECAKSLFKSHMNSLSNHSLSGIKFYCLTLMVGRLNILHRINNRVLTKVLKLFSDLIRNRNTHCSLQLDFYCALSYEIKDIWL